MATKHRTISVPTEKGKTMTDRNKLICLLTKIVPLPFRTLNVIANKLVESGVKIPVHCKDCKHWRGCGEGCGWCEAWDGGRFHDNYCNYGERKDNG